MKKILIVDDDVIIRIAFSKMLESKNYIVKVAKEVGEAVDIMKSEIFDLILLDLKLPPKGWDSGFQILKKKRRIELNNHTPVIIVSGAQEEFIEKNLTLEDNVAHVFLKPVDNQDLLEKISKILGSFGN